MCVYVYRLCDCGVGRTVSARLVIARVETSSIIASFLSLLIYEAFDRRR